MTTSRRFAQMAVAVGFAFAALPAAVAVAEPATAPDAVSPAACSLNPLPGHVTFYQHTNCGGAYQDMARCGTHPFTGALYRQASSYWDRQTGGAYAIAYEYVEGRGNVQAFKTIPNTGVRNVAERENDRNEWANVICP